MPTKSVNVHHNSIAVKQKRPVATLLSSSWLQVISVISRFSQVSGLAETQQTIFVSSERLEIDISFVTHIPDDSAMLVYPESRLKEDEPAPEDELEADEEGRSRWWEGSGG